MDRPSSTDVGAVHSGGMRFYSDYPLARIRQIAADVTALALVVLAITLGSIVHDAVTTFASLGRQLEDAGRRFSSTMADAADAVGDIPFVGDDIRSPFDDATGTGRAIARAGVEQQVLVDQLALLLGLLVALVPVVVVLRYWLARRISFARRAAVAASLAQADGGVDLLALRALGRGDPRVLLRATPDAVARWRAGDPVAVRALAELALRDAGVRMP